MPGAAIKAFFLDPTLWIPTGAPLPVDHRLVVRAGLELRVRAGILVQVRDGLKLTLDDGNDVEE